MHSGQTVLTIPARDNSAFGIQIENRKAICQVSKPVVIIVVDAAGAESRLETAYQTAKPEGNGIECSGTITTAHGTQFHVVDTYTPLPKDDAFTVSRVLTIATPSPEDTGFTSEFSLSPESQSLADAEWFAPGIWYQHNAHVPPRALAGSTEEKHSIFREDRLPLPLIAQRNPNTGTTILLAHLDGIPSTFVGETGRDRIIDDRMQFGAIGIENIEAPSPTFLFPGSEGERTYVRAKGKQVGWAYRSHPVRVGVQHAYRLLIRLGHTDSFADAVKQSWRTVYDLSPPPVVPADLNKVYHASMELAATFCQPYEGTTGVPFAATVPEGKVVDPSSQMGFVGQALPTAALLLRYGYETKDSPLVARATAVVDFWAKNCLSPAGVPRTWYDVHPNQPVTWRNYHTFLRVASDGLDGALRAWNVARQHSEDKPGWLAFCRIYGDWLLAKQSNDGSWSREYDAAGQVVSSATDTTDQAIPFLIDLYRATGDVRYRDAAQRAGNFCLHSVDVSYAYVGGTPDNPNVMDKEGGMMALAAFLALYDVSGDKQFLHAAVQAADYCETWVYCWNIPMPIGDDLALIYPRTRTTFGLSLIAAGHSGADNYMAAAPFFYYRLYLLTGDAHYRKFARMLLYDTKQMMDWDGTLGYAYPGLLTEALSLASPRGHGVTHYLPWLTVAILDPMVRLQDTFGSIDIGLSETQDSKTLLKRNARYGETGGFMPLEQK